MVLLVALTTLQPGKIVLFSHCFHRASYWALVTLVNALKHKDLKRGVARLCIGGGEGTALALELV